MEPALSHEDIGGKSIPGGKEHMHWGPVLGGNSLVWITEGAQVAGAEVVMGLTLMVSDDVRVGTRSGTTKISNQHLGPYPGCGLFKDSSLDKNGF